MFSVIYFFFYIKLACILDWVFSNLKKKKKKKKIGKESPLICMKITQTKFFKLPKCIKNYWTQTITFENLVNCLL